MDENVKENNEGAKEVPESKFRRYATNELKEFVQNVVGNKVFLLQQMSPIQQETLVPMVFVPIALGALEGWSEEDIKNIGTIYGFYDEAGPRSINGLPIFNRMHIMHKDDWERARVAISFLQTQLDEVKV